MQKNQFILIFKLKFDIISLSRHGQTTARRPPQPPMVLKIHNREGMQKIAASRGQFSLLRSFNIIGLSRFASSLRSRRSSWVRISGRIWFQYWCFKNFGPCPIFLPAQNKPTADKKRTESPLMGCCQIGYWSFFFFFHFII